MKRNPLKHYVPLLPRGLYGRAALILILPVVFLQLLVSVIFIQRDLEDITTQMTLTMVRELQLINAEIAQTGSPAEAEDRLTPFLAPLNMTLRFLPEDEAIPHDHLRWNEMTGYVVRARIRQNFPPFLSLQLPTNKQAIVVFESPLGPTEVSFSRRRVSPATPHQLIVTLVLSGFLVIAVSTVYMRNQLRPIKRLAEAAEAFGRGRMIPYTPRGATEVRAAGSAFVSMRARIERQIEQRTLMLSGVSHDLRTPLTRLKLGLSLSEDEDAEDMLRDVKEMEELVDSFLDFSRGVATADSESCDVQTMLDDLVQRWQRQGKQVSLAEPEGNREVMLRKMAVQRGVNNLISNAVRYGTRAKVSLTVMQKSLRIRVEDDGPGIPAEMRGDALRPFVRLDPARNQDKGSGVGLGLAIVADIARAHGGTLRLGTSQELGGLCADIVIAI